jgi:hypothetical protein
MEPTLTVALMIGRTPGVAQHQRHGGGMQFRVLWNVEWFHQVMKIMFCFPVAMKVCL